MSRLKTLIDANIKENGNQEITGKVLNYVLTEISNEISGEGYYPLMHVGLADDLAGHGESVPAEFTFRASGGKSIKDGRAYLKRIKGNSVVWNQKLNQQELTLGIGELTETDTEIIIVPPSNDNSNRYGTAVDIIEGHYYLQAVDILSETGGNVGFQNYLHLDIYNKTTSTSYVLLWNIVKAGSSGRAYVQIQGQNGAAYRIRKGSFVLRDLTQMFGAGNEPTTIEEFNARKPIVEDENAFNKGEVIHMTAEGIKSVGDNAWDEQWEQGRLIEGDGQEYDSSSDFRSKNFIRVLPNTQYYFRKPAGVFLLPFYYDENKNFIAADDVLFTSQEGNTFTTLNASYMRFYCNQPTYNNDIMLTLVHSGWKQDTDAGYQPYWEDILPLSIISKYFPNGMQSAGSAYDEIRYNKATNKWEAVQRIGVLDNIGQYIRFYKGNINYDSEQSVNWMIDEIKNMVKIPSNNGVVGGLLCDKLIAKTADQTYSCNEGLSIESNGEIAIHDSEYHLVGDMNAVKSKYADASLYYQLAEPIVTEITEDFRDYYKVADFGTERMVAEQSSAPFKADIIYQFNAVDMIREHELEITELQKVIATMQAQLASLANI